MQTKDHPFQAKATAEFAKLRRLQAEIEVETGQVCRSRMCHVSTLVPAMSSLPCHCAFFCMHCSPLVPQAETDVETGQMCVMCRLSCLLHVLCLPSVLHSMYSAFHLYCLLCTMPSISTACYVLCLPSVLLIVHSAFHLYCFQCTLPPICTADYVLSLPFVLLIMHSTLYLYCLLCALPFICTACHVRIESEGAPLRLSCDQRCCMCCIWSCR